ncbi:tetratricopeptide repeat protein [uncultured Bacteroides sp.]|uniref:tetratricopeptide repeat protein n=1 Tax=uncultured Bacteroides sp. TaxID=162156 RepID=UPI0025EF5A99|nr:tetratricopeptide repeat protein [uncultured Bacteroides sp.]
MKHKISRILCTALCCAPLLANAQTSEKSTSPQRLYQEGQTLFQQKAYAAAISPLQAFVRQMDAEGKPLPATGERQEAEYMLVCAAYELRDPKSVELLRAFLEEYPDTPYANRIYALIASAYFFEGKYDDALAMFNSARLELLGSEERDDMTYRLATCYLKTGNVKEAAVWFETLRSTSKKYAADCSYYISYIRYTQQRYDEALSGFLFLPLQDNAKYKALVPYYIAEIYLIKKNYDKAEIVAQNYLSAYPSQTYTAEMYRVLGTAQYHFGKYHEAMASFENYLKSNSEPAQRRDALYMLGMSYYQCGVYSKVPTTLGEVTVENDTLSQNAYLHMGLAYLQLGDKTKARMAFEQAAASNADLKIKEQAAYNYALCIHETSYSAFGESVTVFEKFLNEFPNSVYADKVSNYLVEVYMNTRSYDAALKSIERISHPGKSILEAKQKILFQLGTQSFANTQFEQAIGYFNQSIALGQYNLQTKADALYWLGESYYRLNRMQEAARNFNEYLSLTQQRNTEMFALAYYNLGYIAFHQKEYAAAESRFRNFVQLEKGENPTALADAYNRIGDCNLHVRRFDEAKQYYTKAEKLETPAGDYSFYQLALVAGLQKDYSGKVSLLDRLAGKYPNSPYAVNALYEKGRSYVQSNNSRQAIASFRELLNKYPESPVSRKAAAEIGLLYYQNDDYDRAIDAYKFVVKQYPGSEESRLAMRDLKSIYVDANRVDEFAALASQMPGEIRFDPSEQDSLTYIAAEKIYMKGEATPAKNSFARYLQSFPDGAFSLNAHYYLCVIGKEQKDEEAVLLHAGKLLEYPDNPYSEEALLMHGEILFNRKQYDQAIADYKKLQAKASTAERRQLGSIGVLRCAALMGDDADVIQSATSLLAEAKLSPELRNEALYYRAKSYLRQKADKKAMDDLKLLAKDTRTLYGAEAKFLVAQQLYNAREYPAAEKEILDYIDQSTPHAYWLARSFVLLSDVYVAMDKKLDARQYLLSLQQNYQADDDIAGMINERLEKLK